MPNLNIQEVCRKYVARISKKLYFYSGFKSLKNTLVIIIPASYARLSA